MIKSIEITNHRDEVLTLELRSPDKSGFRVLSIDGLGPPKGDIFVNEVAALDGGMYNSARANQRNIVFLLEFVANPSVERTRQLTYKHFPLKERVKIVVNTTEKSVYTYGFVESNEPDIFRERERATISVLCPDSWLYDVNSGLCIFGAISSLFTFPWSNESTTEGLVVFSEIVSETVKYLYYSGGVNIGILIHIHANDDASGIVISDEGSNVIEIDSTKLVEITGADISQFDDIYISTVRGDKYAKLIRSTTEYDILNALGEDPHWFQLTQGDNMFVYTADSGLLYLSFDISYEVAYQGV